MKKLLAILLVLCTLTYTLASCTVHDDTTVRIGVLNGPTGMGMAKLMSDAKSDEASQYDFTSFSAPADAIPMLKKGELDMLCLPTNVAALQASKLDSTIIAINCLGSLYLMTDENTTIEKLSDLAGKTVYASVPDSTTGPILNFLFTEAGIDVNVEFEANHDALVARIAKGEVSIAVLPEPKASAAATQNAKYSIDLNLSTEWSKLSNQPLTMGCIVVRNEFLAEHKSVVDEFLAKYKSSIEYINAPANKDSAAAMITEAGIIPKLVMANKALTNLYGSIVYIDGEDMKNALNSFYTAIGQSLPDESIYYVK